MLRHITVAVVAILALTAHVRAQWWDMGLASSPNPAFGAWGGSQRQQNNDRFITCSAFNADGDSLKVTFTSSTPANRWGAWGNMGGAWVGRQSLRLSAVLTASQTSSLRGSVELVVTTGSRSEIFCLSSALGNILEERNWWMPNDRPVGVLATPIMIMPGQTAAISEEVERLTFDQILGRGMAVCPSNQIVGNTCQDLIPLCCRLGLDSQPATTPFTSGSQMFPGAQSPAMGQAGDFGMQFGMPAGGSNLGMPSPQGFAPMGTGMNQGLAPMGAQTLGGGVNMGQPNQGMGGQGQSLVMGGGVNQGLPPMGGNPGMTGATQGGQQMGVGMTMAGGQMGLGGGQLGGAF